jgi:hypothetical protein
MGEKKITETWIGYRQYAWFLFLSYTIVISYVMLLKMFALLNGSPCPEAEETQINLC